MSGAPETFMQMLATWNETDAGVVRARAEQILLPDVVFCDPHYDIRGIDAWVAMVMEFHTKYPGARIERTSGIDVHHDRARYSWAVVLPNGRRLDGFDAARFDKASGRISRIDGFFGSLPAM